jgi:hypothetical protein
MVGLRLREGVDVAALARATVGGEHVSTRDIDEECSSQRTRAYERVKVG